MEDMTTLLTTAETFWTAVAALSVVIIGFVLGAKLVKKIKG